MEVASFTIKGGGNQLFGHMLKMKKKRLIEIVEHYPSTLQLKISLYLQR